MDNNKSKICPYCKTEIKPEDNVVQCSDCEMPHHMECWVENNGCTTFGCSGTIQKAGAEAYGADFDIDVYGAESGNSPKFCPNCGEKVTPGSRFCMSCGVSLGVVQPPKPPECPNCKARIEPGQAFCGSCGTKTSGGDMVEQTVATYMKLTQEQENPVNDIKENKWISMLSYLGILLLVPLLTKKESSFAKFHVNQGVLCLIPSVGIWVLGFFPVIGALIRIAGFIVSLVFSIMGIYNCYAEEMKELPLIGKYRIIK